MNAPARDLTFSPRSDWTREEIAALFALPFPELMFRAQSVHRAHFDPAQVQISQLLSIKTGGCPEDCGYCTQSVHNKTGLKATKLMEVESVLAEARAAKASGVSRFCMGAAWRNPKDKDLDTVCAMVEGVKALGMETCVTLGMLTGTQATRLKESGLDYYNHNIDTSPEYYRHIVSTRTYQERLDTLAHVRDAGINVCCGGIVGMGESAEDRVGLIHALATLPVHPESVPINALVGADTPAADSSPKLPHLDFVRTIAVARITMPRSMVRLSAGREDMSDEAQALCFMAGANSIFYGPKLLTTPNPVADTDRALFAKLGLSPMPLAPESTHQEIAAPLMVKLGAYLMILLLGAVILVPIVMALELDAMPGDFVLSWNSHPYHVPVIWSLCASGALTLLYSLYRR